MKVKAGLRVLTFVLFVNFGLTFDEEKSKTFLLPGDLKTTHYNVHLITKIDKFDLGNDSSFTFDGEVQMFMHSVKHNVTEVVVNLGEYVTVRETALHRTGAKPVSLGTGKYNKTTEKVTFPLPFTVRKGESLRFDVNFTGGHNFSGFVEDFYYGKNGSKRWFVYTDLQPANARFVFPCFDEPRYKATYNISVSVPRVLISDGYRALSNTAESWREEVGENTRIHFEMTPIPMSTYLFAVIVSDYTSTTPRYFNGSHPNFKSGELRTWAKPEMMETYGGNLSQAIASALIKIYTEDFGIGYDFGKVDQVCVHGYPMALENWGLIFYDHTFLEGYFDYSAPIIAHELSHQWFGNLVTLHWWSDVWLNEGFATYFQYFGADKINGEGMNGKDWNFPYQFVVDTVQLRGMSTDVPENFNHPLTVEVYDPNEYGEYFNRYSYGKGASIIYMWRNIFGEKAFKNVLRYYLRSFQVGVATPEGLLSCFDRYANESESDLNGMKPSEIFKNWHVKAGVPIVSVRKIENNPPVYVLSQDVFRLNKSTQVEKSEWTIPISYSTSESYNFNSTKAEIWLTPERNKILKLPKPVKWMIVNNQETGYYRVNYNIENWKALFHVLSESEHEIHEINRAQIVDDAMEIARSTAFDYLPYDMVLDMLLYLKKESSPFPWKSALNKLEFLKNQLSKHRLVYPLFRMFVLDLLSDRVEGSWLARQKCSGYGHKLEKKIISWACEMGHPVCSKPQIRKDCGDSLEVAYCAHVRDNSDRIFWDEEWRDYETTKDPNRKLSLLRGLGCSKNEIFLKRLLEKSIDENGKFSRTERNEMVLVVLEGNAENVKTLLDFIEDNVEQLKTALSRRHLEWDIIIGIAERLSTQDEISRMLKLTTDLGRLTETKTASDKVLRTAMRIMSANSEWQRVRSKSVSDWLVSRYSTGGKVRA